MIFELNTSETPDIDWAATGTAEVVQNVFTLITTHKYEVAYDRTLGLDAGYVDLPLAESIAFATAQIYAAIDEREPRATVEDVQYTGTDEEGNMILRVVIDV